MADTIMYATSPVMIEIIFFAFINPDLSVCKGTTFFEKNGTFPIKKQKIALQNFLQFVIRLIG